MIRPLDKDVSAPYFCTVKPKERYPQDTNQLAKLIMDIATRDRTKQAPSKKSSGKRNTKTVKKGSKK
jgi:hypothetical protein